MSSQKYDKGYFLQEYYKENSIFCVTGYCEKMHRCVLGFWIRKKNSERSLEENPNRIEILQGLAQLTVEMNKKIENLFRNIQRKSGVKAPITPPVYRLKLHSCSSHEIVPIGSNSD